MKNPKAYNLFVQSLEQLAQGGLLFHHIEKCIYITDSTRKLLGIWDTDAGKPAPLIVP